MGAPVIHHLNIICMQMTFTSTHRVSATDRVVVAGSCSASSGTKYGNGCQIRVGTSVANLDKYKPVMGKHKMCTTWQNAHIKNRLPVNAGVLGDSNRFSALADLVEEGDDEPWTMSADYAYDRWLQRQVKGVIYKDKRADRLIDLYQDIKEEVLPCLVEHIKPVLMLEREKMLNEVQLHQARIQGGWKHWKELRLQTMADRLLKGDPIRTEEEYNLMIDWDLFDWYSVSEKLLYLMRYKWFRERQARVPVYEHGWLIGEPDRTVSRSTKRNVYRRSLRGWVRDWERQAFDNLVLPVIEEVQEEEMLAYASSLFEHDVITHAGESDVPEERPPLSIHVDGSESDWETLASVGYEAAPGILAMLKAFSKTLDSATPTIKDVGLAVVDVISCLFNISRAKDRLEFASQMYVSIRLLSRMFPTTLITQISQRFTHQVETQAGDGDGWKSLSTCLNTLWSGAVNWLECPAADLVIDLLNVFVFCGFMKEETLDLFAQKGYCKFAKKVKREVTGMGDVVLVGMKTAMMATDCISNYYEHGMVDFTGWSCGSRKEIFMEYQHLVAELEEAKYGKLAEPGRSSSAKYKRIQDFNAGIDRVLDGATLECKKGDIHHQRMYGGIVAKCLDMKTQLTTYRRCTASRIKPYTFSIFGPTSSMKSTVSQAVWRQIAASNGLSTESTNFCTVNFKDQYFSEVRDQEILVLDDFMNEKESAAMTISPIRVLLDWSSNVPVQLPAPDIPNKGQRYCFAQVLGLTCHAQEFHASTLSHQPSAAYRRVEVYIEVDMKKEFRDSDGQPDATKIPMDEFFPDIWNFYLWKCVINGNSYAFRKVNQEPMDNVALLEWLDVDSRRHFGVQEKIVRKLNNPNWVCEHKRIRGTCKECKAAQIEDASLCSVPRYMSMDQVKKVGSRVFSDDHFFGSEVVFTTISDTLGFTSEEEVEAYFTAIHTAGREAWRKMDASTQAEEFDVDAMLRNIAMRDEENADVDAYLRRLAVLIAPGVIRAVRDIPPEAPVECFYLDIPLPHRWNGEIDLRAANEVLAANVQRYCDYIMNAAQGCTAVRAEIREFDVRCRIWVIPQPPSLYMSDCSDDERDDVHVQAGAEEFVYQLEQRGEVQPGGEARISRFLDDVQSNLKPRNFVAKWRLDLHKRAILTTRKGTAVAMKDYPFFYTIMWLLAWVRIPATLLACALLSFHRGSKVAIALIEHVFAHGLSFVGVCRVFWQQVFRSKWLLWGDAMEYTLDEWIYPTELRRVMACAKAKEEGGMVEYAKAEIYYRYNPPPSFLELSCGKTVSSVLRTTLNIAGYLAALTAIYKMYQAWSDLYRSPWINTNDGKELEKQMKQRGMVLRSNDGEIEVMEVTTHADEVGRPLREEGERALTWCPPIPEKLSLGWASMTTTPEALRAKLDRNLLWVSLKYGPEYKRHSEFHALAIGGCDWLIPAHVLKKEVNAYKFEGKMTFDGSLAPHSVGGFTWNNVVLLPDSDFALVRVQGTTPKTSLMGFFPKEEVFGGYAALVHHTPNGLVTSSLQVKTKSVKMDVKHAGEFYKTMNVSWSDEYPLDTYVGLCGAVWLGNPERKPYIHSLHICGSHGSVGGSEVITAGKLEAAQQELIDRNILPTAEGVNYPLETQAFEWTPQIPSTHFVNFIAQKDGEYPSLDVIGSHNSHSGKYKQDIRETAIASALREKLEWPVVHKPVPFPNATRHFNHAMDEIAYPRNDFEPDILELAVNDYMEKVLDHVSSIPELSQKVMPLDDVVVVSGMDDMVAFSKMNPKTSAGFPEKGPKGRFFVDVEEDPDVSVPMTMDDEHLAQAAVMEDTLAAGKRVYAPFTLSVKIEPVKVTKEYARLFGASNMIFTFVFRKYYLSIFRLIQLNPFAFEMALGINVHSEDWDQLAKMMCHKDRIIEGDYQTYDKTMGAAIIMHSFDVLIAIARKAGYSMRQLMIMKSIATEVAFPTYEGRGVLFVANGSNPSGHPGTFIINCIANSLFMRYAFFWQIHKTLPSPHPKLLVFDDYVQLITAGDDHLASVSNECDWFNQHIVQAAMASVRVGYTDGKKNPVFESDFISLDEASFVSRGFRYCEYLGRVVAPLALKSLQKSYMIHNISRDCPMTPNELLATVVEQNNIELFFLGEEKFNHLYRIVREAMCEVGLGRFLTPERTWQQYGDLIKERAKCGYRLEITTQAGETDVPAHAYQRSCAMINGKRYLGFNTFLEKHKNPRTGIPILPTSMNVHVAPEHIPVAHRTRSKYRPGNYGKDITVRVKITAMRLDQSQRRALLRAIAKWALENGVPRVAIGTRK